MKKTLIAVVLVAGLLFSLTPAMADFVSDFTSYIEVPNTALGTTYGFVGPYVQVDIDLTSDTTADVMFTSLMATHDGDTVIYYMADGTAAGLNVNATDFSVTNEQGFNTTGTGFTPAVSVDNPPGTSNVSDFGSFNAVIDNSDGYGNSADKISFTLTNTGGTWASAGDVLAFNADGYDAVAHVFPALYDPANGQPNATNDVFTGQTGFAGEVPLPPAVFLMGSGLLGLGLLGFRRRGKG